MARIERIAGRILDFTESMGEALIYSILHPVGGIKAAGGSIANMTNTLLSFLVGLFGLEPVSSARPGDRRRTNSASPKRPTVQLLILRKAGPTYSPRDPNDADRDTANQKFSGNTNPLYDSVIFDSQSADLLDTSFDSGFAKRCALCGTLYSQLGFLYCRADGFLLTDAYEMDAPDTSDLVSKSRGPYAIA